jgi:hypothetical protein
LYVMGIKNILVLESGGTHRDAQYFSFIASGDNASVVIG